MDPSKCVLTYHVSGSGFLMKQHDETTFPTGSESILTTQPFSIFITGDLSYYADVFGNTK